MPMQVHEITLTKKLSGKTSKRVGRGGKRGKTSGRGHKGQNARAGRKKRPEMRDVIKKIPKLRGHGINRSRTVNDGKIKNTPINFSVIENNFENGETVSVDTLLEKGVISLLSGKKPKVKVLAKGDFTKKLNFEGVELSKVAREAVEKLGGNVK